MTESIKERTTYNFYARFPASYKTKIQFITEVTYLSKVSILKKLIDEEYKRLKIGGSVSSY